MPELDPAIAARLAPEMLRLARGFARSSAPPLHTLSVQAARAQQARGISLLDVPPAPLVRVQALEITARDGFPLPAQLCAPRAAAQGAPLPVLLFFHGGGYVTCSVATHAAVCRAISQESGAAVLSLDYRLAPEWRFPTAVHDAIDALEWLAAGGATQLGLNGARIAVGGDSAGGTLAAVCALHARRAGLPLALQLLIYPGTVGRADYPSRTLYARTPLLGAEAVRWFFAHYIDAGDMDDWRFSPLLVDAAAMAGSAPAWLALAECDMLHDEGAAYAAKLRAAGVRVHVQEYAGVMHGFLGMGRMLPQARRLQRDAGAALRAAFGMG